MNSIISTQLVFVISGGLLHVGNANQPDENVLLPNPKWSLKPNNDSEMSGLVFQNGERALSDKNLDVPEYTVQIGNYTWLQIALIVVVWCLIAGVSMLFVLGQEFRKHFLDNSRMLKEADEVIEVLNNLFWRSYDKY